MLYNARIDSVGSLQYNVNRCPDHWLRSVITASVIGGERGANHQYARAGSGTSPPSLLGRLVVVIVSVVA